MSCFRRSLQPHFGISKGEGKEEEKGEGEESKIRYCQPQQNNQNFLG